MRAPPIGEAHLDDPALSTLRQLSGAAMRPTGPVDHRVRAAGTVAVGPLLGRRGRALESFRGPGVGPSVLDDTTGEPQPALRSQTGISVDHEDLSVAMCVW